MNSLISRKIMMSQWTLLALLALLNGCSSASSMAEGQARMFNKDLASKQLPFRYVVKEGPRGGYVATPDWAGTPADSMTLVSPLLNADIHAAIEQHCGHTRQNLVETRLVEVKIPVVYEVWVFLDPQSKRQDGLSGLSVIMTQLPNEGGVNFSVRGACHAPGEVTFGFN